MRSSVNGRQNPLLAPARTVHDRDRGRFEVRPVEPRYLAVGGNEIEHFNRPRINASNSTALAWRR
jgi:hypothetical protein